MNGWAQVIEKSGRKARLRVALAATCQKNFNVSILVVSLPRENHSATGIPLPLHPCAQYAVRNSTSGRATKDHQVYQLIPFHRNRPSRKSIGRPMSDMIDNRRRRGA